MLVKIEHIPQGYLIERAGLPNTLPKNPFRAELTLVEKPVSPSLGDVSPSAKLHAILDGAQPAAVGKDDYLDYLAAKYS
ncbi:hypothetical protein CCR95_14765 [Thiocystis minor]|uniref:hypothetical protein n=1 Tax=Thiocystis minor TaxID=61597 RepID=UPI001912AAC6|nr:hypothetical protein [Thiocystis minor]MBK5965312.1 hypothetical protein [Thiocystis minor]